MEFHKKFHERKVYPPNPIDDAEQAVIVTENKYKELLNRFYKWIYEDSLKEDKG